MISVIVPAYDDGGAVMSALNSMRALADGPAEYVVQDDCSPHIDLRMLIPPEIAKADRNEVNLGFGANCNRAAARSTGDILFFVNQDVTASHQLSAGWDSRLAETFSVSESIGIVCPLLLFPDGTVQSAGGMIDGACQPVHRCLGYRNIHHPSVSLPRKVTWGTGAALAIRRSLFESLGGFDEVYRMYWEDVDLCIRAGQEGFDVLYDPHIVLVHSVGSTGGSPHFNASASTFKKRWVDTGIVKPETSAIHVRYW